MSEYQYYEFQAVDRPLDDREQRELRAISSRATISSTRFANSYSFGDLKVAAATLVDRYFDAHLYLANWGSRALAFRFPKRVLPLEVARRYCRGDSACARAKGDHVIVDLRSEEEGSGWVEDEEGPGHFAAILPMRAHVVSGDLRALYLAWLLCVQSGDLDDADEEPPCPPGLRTLSAPLKAMIDFLRIDRDLVEAAAVRSQDAVEPGTEDIDRWVKSLPDADRAALLARFIEGAEPLLRFDVLRRLRASTAGVQGANVVGPRSVREILAEAERRREAQRHEEEARATRERALREREAAEARGLELDALARREVHAWAKVDAHVATRQPRRYDEAAMLLRDLRDLGARRGDAPDIEARIERLCAEHAGKPSFVRRVRAMLLGGPLDDASATEANGARPTPVLRRRRRVR